MSLALVAPAPAALAEPQHALVLEQLSVLDADLARAEDVSELLNLHGRASVLGAYCREANVAAELALRAVESKLRLERKIGLELDRIIGATPSWESHKHDRRMRVPRGLLKRLNVSGSQSSRWRQLGRLPEELFEEQLRAARAGRRELTTSRLVRLARTLTDSPRHGGRPRLSVRTKLRRILAYAREITRVDTPQERQLLRDVLVVTWGWHAAVGRPDVLARRASCLLCGRDRPAFDPPARCPCGGKWVVS